MKHIFSLVLLIGLFLFIPFSSAQDAAQCSPHIDVISDLLTQAQGKFDSKDTQAGLNILTQAQSQLGLELGSCLNYAPDTAGDKRSNPVKFGDWKSIEIGSKAPASVQIVDFIDAVDPKSAVGKEPDSGKKYIAFKINLHCKASPDDYCTLNAFTGVSVVGTKGIEYISKHTNKLQDDKKPTKVYGTGELNYICVFAVDADDTNFEIQIVNKFPKTAWFATQ